MGSHLWNRSEKSTRRADLNQSSTHPKRTPSTRMSTSWQSCYAVGQPSTTVHRYRTCDVFRPYNPCEVCDIRPHPYGDCPPDFPQLNDLRNILLPVCILYTYMCAAQATECSLTRRSLAWPRPVWPPAGAARCYHCSCASSCGRPGGGGAPWSRLQCPLRRCTRR